MSFQQTTGTRAQVWHGTAKKTSGGLTKSALMMNKHGRIVSRKMHNTAKKEKRLVKAGFLTKKGQFGFIKKGSRKNKSKKMRGGTGSAVGSGNLGAPLDRALLAGGRSRRMRGGYNLLMPPGWGGRSRRMRGGMASSGALSPSNYDGTGVGTSGVGLQFVAGNAA